LQPVKYENDLIPAEARALIQEWHKYSQVRQPMALNLSLKQGAMKKMMNIKHIAAGCSHVLATTD
jgi:alpha-tubulin suppressor-like RCC1 family protein